MLVNHLRQQKLTLCLPISSLHLWATVPKSDKIYIQIKGDSSETDNHYYDAAITIIKLWGTKRRKWKIGEKITSRKAKDVMCLPSTVIWIPSDPTLRVATERYPCLKGKYFLDLAPSWTMLDLFVAMTCRAAMILPTISLHWSNSSTEKKVNK